MILKRAERLNEGKKMSGKNDLLLPGKDSKKQKKKHRS